MTDRHVRDLDDHARQAFANERVYRSQQAVYQQSSGPDAREVLLSTVNALQGRPGGLLVDVGCGEGALARSLAAAGWRALAQDNSVRMCELSRSAGLDVQVAALPNLPLKDGALDCVVAAWVLHYLTGARLSAALDEIRRVLRSDGTLVAATNSDQHMAQLWARLPGARYRLSFSAENAVGLLESRGWEATAIPVTGTVTFLDYPQAHEFVANQVQPRSVADRLQPFTGSLPVSRRSAIVVARRSGSLS
jgi:SAM-dependent methyltransferase